MVRSLRRSRRTFALALAFALTTLVLGGVRPGRSDDTELLRFQTQNPYLMIVLDTSRSMNLAIAADTPLPGGGDNPDSRINAAKAALFSVFRNVLDVNFGFASFNQDQIKVRGKHWLYFINRSDLPSFPDIGWPTPSPNLPMVLADTDGDGVIDIEPNPLFTDNGAANGNPADLITFGTTFRDASNNPITTAGTCASPLSAKDADDRARLNSFAKNGSDNLITTLWVSSVTGNKTYRITFNRDPSTSLGQAGKLPIKVSADEVSNCSSPPAVSAGVTIQFSKQDALNDYLFIDNGPTGERNGEDVTAHQWAWKDAVDGYQCTNARPFNGYGTEGNYDSGKKPSEDGILGSPFETKITNTDEFCFVPIGDTQTLCIKIKPIKQTHYDTRGRPLDSGDFLPWDWSNPNRIEFLQRLAPNWDEVTNPTPDFGVGTYFQDAAVDSSGIRRLENDSRKPLIAEGDTAIARALIDLRCWYMGTAEEHGNSKCRDSPFSTDFDGWRNVACQQNGGDPNFGCRRPFLIVISDGDSDSNDCQENNPTASVSDMDQHSAVKTWYVQVGPTKSNKGCQGSGLGNSLANAGGGECVVVANKQQLLQTINKILGIIREATRAFASAAVPTVQASVQQSIYVSNFTPLRNNSTWDGHMNAFLKPLPLLNGKPDTSKLCSALPANQRAGCFLWDAGKVLVDTQYPFDKNCSPIPSGSTTAPCPAPAGSPTNWRALDKRRVYYSQLGSSGQWSNQVRLFETTIKGTTPQQVERDLWSALGVAFDPDPLSTNDPVRDAANATITRALTLKQALVQGETTPRKFLMGDVFHSDPVVVGNPNDLRYFAQDLGHVASTNCDANPNSNTDKGYRCFFARQQFRRKLLLVGHNDGMLHAYNAGTYNSSTKVFSSGSGNEVFAFIPRKVMPAVNLMAQSGASTHRFTVDSSPVVTDVLIDPSFTLGTPVAAKREWRTVAVGGLREGGRAYFAIDITEPEVLQKVGTEYIPQSSNDTNYVPACMWDWQLLPSRPADCGRISYGAALWEFTDVSNDQTTAPAVAVPSRVPMDEDDNGFPDLGDTWSIPDVGRIRVCTGGDCTKVANLQDRYVTIFGGGLDPENKTTPRGGTFVYMVDIETGQTLYKRQLPSFNGTPAGAIPAAPTVVDLDNDGYLDRLYIVTTGGYLYRIDLGKDSSGAYPELKSESVRTINDGIFTVLRVDPTFWQPRLIFDATLDVDTGTRTRRPLYYRPSVFFVAKLGLAGIAFGSGEREDLWTVDNQNGRFWVFVDDTDRTGAVLPYDESQLLRIDINTGANLGANDLFVTRSRGQKGWFFVLGKNQRLITPGFALFGVMFFSSYEPLTFATTSPTCDPLNPPPGGCPILQQSCSPGSQEQTGYCAKTGTSRLFIVNVTNGDGLLPTLSGSFNRFKAIAQFVTQPFTEPGQSHNTATSGSGPTADDLSADDIKVMNIIKGLFPADCRFSNFRIDVKTIASDTSVQRIAAVPQCIIQKNWKEF